MTNDQSMEKDRTLLYVVGELPDTNSAVLSDIFQIEAYNGENDAYLLLVSVMVETPTKATCEVVREAWQKGGKIVLLSPTSSAVRRIKEILEIKRSLTENAATIEYYGIQRQGEHVTDIEIHGERAVHISVAPGGEKRGLDGCEEGTEGEAKRSAGERALVKWLRAPAPEGMGTVTLSSGPAELDFIKNELTTRFYLLWGGEWQEVWYAIRVYSKEQKHYYVSYWVDISYNPSPQLPITWWSFNVHQILVRRRGARENQCWMPEWATDNPISDWQAMRQGELSNRVDRWSPGTTPEPVMTVEVSVSESVGGSVTVGTSGADATFSYGVTWGESRAVTVPELRVFAEHILAHGLPRWRVQHTQAVRSNTRNFQFGWINRFSPDNIPIEGGVREIMLCVGVTQRDDTNLPHEERNISFGSWINVPLPGVV